MDDKIMSTEEIASKKSLQMVASEVNKMQQECLKQNIKDEIMAQDIKDIKQDIKTLSEKFSVLCDKLDNRYASKWVEKAVATLIGIMALASLYFIFAKTGLK